MKKIIVLSVISMVLALSLGGCDQRTAGAAIGGGAGAGIGSALGGTGGAIIGGAAGGALGSHLAR